jgi:Aerotolerance regulator N-terminal/von Willebrand factor type A domain
MAFVNPWMMVLGVAGALLPVLIHWLTRPRPVVFPLSTVRFVVQAIQQRRSRRRLRDFVILAVRTIVVLLLAAAIARPIVGRRPPSLAEANAATTRVVLLDVSQSMAARTKGIQAFERARPVAATYLEFRPGLAANLLLAGASTHSAFDRPSTNFGAFRDELGRAAPRPERLNLQTALNAAVEMFGHGRGEGGRGGAHRSELVIISDFQRTQWASADFSGFPRDMPIRLESVGAGETPPNLAVLRVGGSDRAEAGRPLTVEVDVGNFSTAGRSVEVELELENASYRLAGVCPAGVRTTLSAEIVPRAAGWQTGRAKLVGMSDALVEDDVRPFVLNVRPPPLFALVTREPAAARPSSSYYLERALLPTAHEPSDDRPSPRVVRFDPEHADRDEALATADLVVLDHPGRLPEALITRLAGWLRRGRSVLYVACEPADAGNLKNLAELAGSDVHPPVEFSPPATDGALTARFIAEVRRESPPFQIFGDAVTATLAPLRFSGALISRPLPDALADDVRATYGDRSACLVVTTCGAGTLAVLNADLAASNFPTSPAFVPLIGELTAVLLGRRSIEAPVFCGEPFALPLPADAGPLAGLSADRDGKAGDDGSTIDLLEEPAGLVCRQLAAGAPGTVRIQRGARTVFALAKVLPDQESDLTALSASILQGRLAGGRELSYRDSTRVDEAEDSLWAWLALACAIGLAVELILLRVQRS